MSPCGITFCIIVSSVGIGIASRIAFIAALSASESKSAGNAINSLNLSILIPTLSRTDAISSIKPGISCIMALVYFAFSTALATFSADSRPVILKLS